MEYIPQDIRGYFKHGVLIDNFINEDIPQNDARLYLGSAGLKDDMVKSAITDLSYGELMRSALVMVILKRADFIFMDEPTNHLDIESLEILDELLRNFPGGYLAISHDRHFLAANAERVIKF